MENGTPKDILKDSDLWKGHIAKQQVLMGRTEAMHLQLASLTEYCKALPKIDDTLIDIASTLKEFKEVLVDFRAALLPAAVATDKVPLKVFLVTIGVIFAGFIFCLAIASGRHIQTPWITTVPVPVQVQPSVPIPAMPLPTFQERPGYD